VTERSDAFEDPTTVPFWEAAARHELVIQRCRACGTHQFYPRPFCVSCGDIGVEWLAVKGSGTIYSLTTVRMQVVPELTPPYIVAIVELDEGPRLLTNLVGDGGRIGDRVTLEWRDRASAPPLPVFRRCVTARSTPTEGVDTVAPTSARLWAYALLVSSPKRPGVGPRFVRTPRRARTPARSAGRTGGPP
jgi:uncharacterized OB-fold protein